MSKMLLIFTMLIGLSLAGCTTEPESILPADNEGIVIDREAFRERVEVRFQEFEKKLEDLRNKTIEAREEVRAKLRQEIDELHRKEEAARARFAAMRQNSAEKWEEERLHLENALDDLRAGFDRAFSHLP
jgi:predicted RNase H-like nuclease (RuvC/YqgF family)